MCNMLPSKSSSDPTPSAAKCVTEIFNKTYSVCTAYNAGNI